MAFKDIIGQNKAVNILLGTIRQGRVPSSYLFAGESGIGKKFTALNLAKALNCIAPLSDTDCCDKCQSCIKINEHIHPDFLMVAPEKGEIKVKEIRDIEEMLSFAPYEGKRKIVIVDEADKMNQSAANAFLKTLEEPPQHSLIILVSSKPDMLPVTIRSRCSRVSFLPLSTAGCEDVIRAVIGDKKSAEEISSVARLCMGRPGLAIADDLIEDREWFLSLFDKIVNDIVKEEWGEKEDMEKWFNMSAIILRDLAVSKITENEDMLINADMKKKISAMSKTVELKDIIECYIKLSFLKGYLNFNLNKPITWNYTGSVLSKFKGRVSG